MIKNYHHEVKWNDYFLPQSVFGWGQFYLSGCVSESTDYFSKLHRWDEYKTASCSEEAVVMCEVGKKGASVTYMIMLTCCSRPHSMGPICRLTDCQRAGYELWRPLWKSHLCHEHCAIYRQPTFVAFWQGLWVFAHGCTHCFVRLQ